MTYVIRDLANKSTSEEFGPLNYYIGRSRGDSSVPRGEPLWSGITRARRYRHRLCAWFERGLLVRMRRRWNLRIETV